MAANSPEFSDPDATNPVQEDVTRGIRNLHLSEDNPRTHSSSSSSPSSDVCDNVTLKKRKAQSQVTRIIEEESRVGQEFASMPTRKIKRSSSSGDSCTPTKNVPLKTAPSLDPLCLSGSDSKDAEVEPQVQDEALPRSAFVFSFVSLHSVWFLCKETVNACNAMYLFSSRRNEGFLPF